MSVLIDNTDNWISALSNLETVVQDYSVHYEFLEIIEKNSNDNNLKEAASTLREGMSKAMKIKLDTYSEISNENFENYKEFFFTDVFFEVAKQTAEYESDETLSFFVDSGDSIVSSMDVLGDSWELGTMIGTLVGNVVAGGENLINRVLEMMAIYDVSIILQDYLIDTQDNFLSNIGNEEEESYLNKYMSFSQYLIGCRIRGEYCLYSIVANDAGLLNWFNKESAEEAKEWYDNKVDKIINIQNSLLSIKDNAMNEQYSKSCEYNATDLIDKSIPEIVDIMSGDFEVEYGGEKLVYYTSPTIIMYNDTTFPGFAFYIDEATLDYQNGENIKENIKQGKYERYSFLALFGDAKLNDSINADMKYNELTQSLGAFDCSGIAGAGTYSYYANTIGEQTIYLFKSDESLLSTYSGGDIKREWLREHNPELSAIIVYPNQNVAKD